MLLGLVNPYLTKLVVDEGIGNKDLRTFIILAVIGAGVFIFIGLMDGLKEYLERYIKLKIEFDLNKVIFRHLEKLSFSYFQEKSTGEFLYHIGYDIERVKDFITETPPQAITIFPKLVFTLIIIFYLNYQMAIFALCLTPFLCLPPYYFSRKLRNVWEVYIKNSEDIFKGLQEFFSHIHLIKAFGRESAERRDYLGRLIANIRLIVRNIRLEILSNLSGGFINRLIIGLIALYGGYQVIKGRMTLGALTAIMIYLSQLVRMQGSFANFFQTTALGLVSCQRVDRVLDEKSSVIEVQGAKEAVFKRGEIVFEGVSFGYRPQEFVLKDISFNIEGGSHIALVGASGCGKTTILNLILRLYDPWEGEIIIDGHKIKDLRFSSLRGQIGIVLQEPFLLNDSVKRNISYGKNNADDKEIFEAARICTAHDFIIKLLDKYQTVIGENASKISEGQKQKIAIARAIIKRPKILILDEAMSSMDSASEEEIIKNIRGFQKEMTIIVVSHRLSTVMKAERVYFLKNCGEMVISTAEGLLERDREFYNIFSAQTISSG